MKENKGKEEFLTSKNSRGDIQENEHKEVEEGEEEEIANPIGETKTDKSMKHGGGISLSQGMDEMIIQSGSATVNATNKPALNNDRNIFDVFNNGTDDKSLGINNNSGYHDNESLKMINLSSKNSTCVTEDVGHLANTVAGSHWGGNSSIDESSSQNEAEKTPTKSQSMRDNASAMDDTLKNSFNSDDDFRDHAGDDHGLHPIGPTSMRHKRKNEILKTTVIISSDESFLIKSPSVTSANGNNGPPVTANPGVIDTSYSSVDVDFAVISRRHPEEADMIDLCSMSSSSTPGQQLPPEALSVNIIHEIVTNNTSEHGGEGSSQENHYTDSEVERIMCPRIPLIAFSTPIPNKSSSPLIKHHSLTQQCTNDDDPMKGTNSINSNNKTFHESAKAHNLSTINAKELCQTIFDPATGVEKSDGNAPVPMENNTDSSLITMNLRNSGATMKLDELKEETKTSVVDHHQHDSMYDLTFAFPTESIHHHFNNTSSKTTEKPPKNADLDQTDLDASQDKTDGKQQNKSLSFALNIKSNTDQQTISTPTSVEHSIKENADLNLSRHKNTQECSKTELKTFGKGGHQGEWENPDKTFVGSLTGKVNHQHQGLEDNQENLNQTSVSLLYNLTFPFPTSNTDTTIVKEGPTTSTADDCKEATRSSKEPNTGTSDNTGQFSESSKLTTKNDFTSKKSILIGVVCFSF